MRKAPRSLDPRHSVPEGRELDDKLLGICGSDQPDDHVAKGDHGLEMHAEQGSDTISGKVSKQVPVIPEIGDDNTR
jgi:hypothetical protein